MGDLEKAFEASLSDNAQVASVDAAIVETGRQIARQIDASLAEGTPYEKTKALYLAPHLVNVLRELHATPEARRAANIVIADAKGGASNASSSRTGARLAALKGGKSA